ncbi:MAG: hypothetical protein OXE78_15585 [Gammaproteobacteria bacterium]|nr:hypothetical protein [Gammaproteobacteria bacterium]MCY4356119.1 hypothetical protein [Gammaproteobacteria bacterium]
MTEYLGHDFQANLYGHLRDAYKHDPAIEYSPTPLWREFAWPKDWLKLRCSAVYYGLGIPRGNKQPVMLVPGFMSGDLLMLEMHRWLRRMGYDSYLSGIVWNTDCPDKTASQLMNRIHRIHNKTGQRVSLVGHSLGGMISKYIVQSEPGIIDRVITLGSPFKSLVKAHPSVIGIWDQLKDNRSGLVGRNLKPSCATGFCTCGFVRSILQPKEVTPPQFAVFSKNDGVADWHSCLEEDSCMNSEVDCTHIGMVVHPEVYRVVGSRLAEKLTNH